MASCDDDFALLGDEAQSQPPRPPLPQQQQAGAFAAAHRYVTKGPLHIQSRPLPPLATISSPKKGVAGGGHEDPEDFGETFGQTDASNRPGGAPAFPEVGPHHHHCFADDANPFGTPQPDDDDDPNNNPERKSRGAATPGSHPHPHHHGPPPPSRPDPKRKDRDDVSDGESPYCYNSAAKKGRHMSSGDYRKDREEWSDTAIGSLLDAYTERYVQLNRGNLRGRDWEDVATIVSDRWDKQKAGKSVEQCKNKIDNLKKRYKVECQRLSSGGLAVSHWPWFKKMEQVVGSSSSSSKAAADEDKSGALGGTGMVTRQMKRYPAAASGPVNLANNSKMKSLTSPRWKRVVLKISGAALVGAGPQNVDPKVTMLIAREIAMASRVGVEVAVVVGGRNFFSSDTWVAATGIDRAATYQISMMASVMNAILLQASLEKIGVETRVQTALMMQEIAEPYIRRRAIRHLEKGRVVIFGGIGAGTGNPLFSNDTAAALRAFEINADVVLKGTTVDDVYDSNSRNSNNVAFEHISFRELVSRGFTAIDMTAITFCEENNIPVVLFNLLEPGNISSALCGDEVGTLVDETGRIS
ncbi:Uridylate kinase [Cocos nucifera]|uniref:UMP kinase n=1 Tax=Cocos nucifera TaxID=13894 RepID=A0A8K0MY52_COCNU|nr:Uridylate kinase [Cocos nucifera]